MPKKCSRKGDLFTRGDWLSYTPTQQANTTGAQGRVVTASAEVTDPRD